MEYIIWLLLCVVVLMAYVSVVHPEKAAQKAASDAANEQAKQSEIAINELRYQYYASIGQESLDIMMEALGKPLTITDKLEAHREKLESYHGKR